MASKPMPQQIVLSTPRHSYKAASRNGNRSARRQTDMLICGHDDMSNILLSFVSALTHIGVMLIGPENRWLYPNDWQKLSDTIRFDRAGAGSKRCARPHLRFVAHLGDGTWLIA